MSRARAFHALTFAVAAFAVVLQLVLVWHGTTILDESDPPARPTRIVRFCSYLTIWSNVLVAWSTLTLTLGRGRDIRAWRALRNDAVLICFGGGVVHFFLLRPLLDLHGWDAVADHLLHQAVPLLAMVGWLLFGPRRRIDRAELPAFLVVPAIWVAYTLVRGAIVDWYPYPFVDVGRHGLPLVLVNVAGVGVFLTLLYLAAAWLDPRLPGDRTEARV